MELLWNAFIERLINKWTKAHTNKWQDGGQIKCYESQRACAGYYK